MLKVRFDLFKVLSQKRDHFSLNKPFYYETKACIPEASYIYSEYGFFADSYSKLIKSEQYFIFK